MIPLKSSIQVRAETAMANSDWAQARAAIPIAIEMGSGDPKESPTKRVTPKATAAPSVAEIDAATTALMTSETFWNVGRACVTASVSGGTSTVAIAATVTNRTRASVRPQRTGKIDAASVKP